jgi:hypothetical protein
LAKDDAERMAACITRNLEHLKRWMPWATEEAGTLNVRRERFVEEAEAWEQGTDYQYLAVTHEGDVVGRLACTAASATEPWSWITGSMLTP